MSDEQRIERLIRETREIKENLNKMLKSNDDNIKLLKQMFNQCVNQHIY